MTVEKNINIIEERIKNVCKESNRNPEEITVIGVTKYVTIDRAKELLEHGYNHLGENRAEGLLDKYEEIGEKAKWHFIGTLQSRKVKDIINQVTMIHSLDRLSVAKQIENRAHHTVDCFVQVNVSGEDSKHGLDPSEVESFIRDLKQYSKVRVVGLMTMAPHITDKDEIRQVFRQLRILRDEIRSLQLDHAPCKELSMGMSNDFDIAIEEGATYVRIGSSLVGS